MRRLVLTVIYLLLLSFSAKAQAIFDVTTLTDNATTPLAGSLRKAIEDANLATSAAVIRFNIPNTFVVSGEYVFELEAELPIFTNLLGITLDGEEVGGLHDPTASIVLQPSVTLTGINRCIDIEKGPNTISNIIMKGFTNGVRLNSAGNKIYPNVTIIGPYLASYLGTGVILRAGADNCEIGGDITDRVIFNRIYGFKYGVYIYGGCKDPLIQGNIIGNENPTETYWSNQYGIYVTYDAENVVIGGEKLGRNRYNIFLNNASGVLSYNRFLAAPTRISGNYIGVKPDGTINGNNHGVYTAGSTHSQGNIIGELEKPNIIGGNINNGVLLMGTENITQHNYIGVMPDGTAVGNKYGVATVNNSSIKGVVKNNIIGYNTTAGISLKGIDETIQDNYVGVMSDYSICANKKGVFLGAGNVNCTVTGNIVSGNTTQGIYLANVNSGLINNNYVGTNASGSTAISNGTYGIHLYSGSGVIVENNTIGNNTSGIFVQNSNGHIIRSNYIGIIDDGVGNITDIPNKNGIAVLGTKSNLIEDNIICNNSNHGIYHYTLGGLSEQNPVLPEEENVIRLNDIGFYKGVAKPNNVGIRFNDKHTNIYKNFISGNTSYGIRGDNEYFEITDNDIGHEVALVQLGNGNKGVYINVVPTNITPGSDNKILGNRIKYNVRQGINIYKFAGTASNHLLIENNTISNNIAYATAEGQGVRFTNAQHVTLNNNVITNNDKHGVYLNTTAQNITITQNKIYDNGQNGSTDGIRLNPPSNNSITIIPTSISVTEGAPVTGTIDMSYFDLAIDFPATVELFGNDGDPEHALEYLGNDVISNGASTWSIDPNAISSTNYSSYTATITDASGHTSELALVACVLPYIVTQPLSTSIVESNPNTSFNVVANHASSYQWQVNIGAGFQDITNSGIYTGATTNTLNLLNVPASMNNATYQCVISGCSINLISDVVTLSISGSSVLNQTYDDTYAWQVGYNNPITSTHVFLEPSVVVGATQYTIQVDVAADFSSPITKTGSSWLDFGFSGLSSNTQYHVRILADNETLYGLMRPFATDSSPSKGAANLYRTYDVTYGWQSGYNNPTTNINVNLEPTPIVGVTQYTIELDDNASFSSPTTKIGLDWTDFEFNNLNQLTTYYVRVQSNLEPIWGSVRTFVTDCGPTATTFITNNPLSVFINEGENTFFSVTTLNATGYQWQINTNSGFQDLTNTNVYAGVTTNTLTLSNVPVSMNGNIYRCIVKGCGSDLNTTNATISVRGCSEPKNVFYQTYDGSSLISSFNTRINVPHYNAVDQNTIVKSNKLFFELGGASDVYNYNIAITDASVDLQIEVYDQSTVPVLITTIHPVTLTTTADHPLQTVELDFSDYPNYGSFIISSTSNNGLVDNSSLQIRLEQELGHGLLENDGANEIIINKNTFEVEELANGAGFASFSWELPANQQFEYFDLEILKIEPDDDALYDIDWSQANTIEIDANYINVVRNENCLGIDQYGFSVMLTEGTGFYFWRIRPISTYYDGGRADKRNYGTWNTQTAPPSLFSLNSGYPRPNIANNLSTGTILGQDYFYHIQPDNDINWIYNRVFTEGSRVSETMTYANGLNQVGQVQTKLFSKEEVVATQTVYDYSGRPAVNSLPAPIDQEHLGYKDGILKADDGSGNAENYTAKHFDEGKSDRDFTPTRNFDNPDATIAGDIDTYYSNDNVNGYVPNAGGYPFTRTLYESNATGRVFKQGGVGSKMNMGEDHNITTFYSAVFQDELDRIFASEAPLAETVYKVITIDPNNVISISYIAKAGQVIATCLSASNDNKMNMEPLELPEFHVSETFPSANVIPGEIVASVDKTITLDNPSGQALSFNFELPKNNFSTPCDNGASGDFCDSDLSDTGCNDICEECDYKVEIELTFPEDLNDPERNFLVRFNIPPSLGAVACENYVSPDPVLITDMEVIIPDGSGGKMNATSGTHAISSALTAILAETQLPLNFNSDDLFEGTYQVTKRVYVKNEINPINTPGQIYLDLAIQKVIDSGDDWKTEMIDHDGDGNQELCFISCCDIIPLANFSFSCDINYPVCSIDYSTSTDPNADAALDIATAIAGMGALSREKYGLLSDGTTGIDYYSLLNLWLDANGDGINDIATDKVIVGDSYGKTSKLVYHLDNVLLATDIELMLEDGKTCKQIMTCFTMNATLLDINIDLANTYNGQAINTDDPENPTEIGFDADFDYMKNSFDCIGYDPLEAPDPCKNLDQIIVYWQGANLPIPGSGIKSVHIEIPVNGVNTLVSQGLTNGAELAHNLSCLQSYYDIDFTNQTLPANNYFTLHTQSGTFNQQPVSGLIGEIWPQINDREDLGPLELMCNCISFQDPSITSSSLKERVLETCYKACDDKKLATSIAIDNYVLDYNYPTVKVQDNLGNITYQPSGSTYYISADDPTLTGFDPLFGTDNNNPSWLPVPGSEALDNCMVEAVIDNCKAKCYAEVLLDLEDRIDLNTLAGSRTYKDPTYDYVDNTYEYKMKAIEESEDFQKALTYLPKVSPKVIPTCEQVLNHLPTFIYESILKGINNGPLNNIVTVANYKLEANELLYPGTKPIFNNALSNDVNSDNWTVANYQFDFDCPFVGQANYSNEGGSINLSTDYVEHSRAVVNVVYDNNTPAQIIEINFALYSMCDMDASLTQEKAHWAYNPTLASCNPLSQYETSITALKQFLDIHVDESTGIHIIVKDDCVPTQPVFDVENISTNEDNFLIAYDFDFVGVSSSDYILFEFGDKYLTEFPIYWNTNATTTLTNLSDAINQNYGGHNLQSTFDGTTLFIKIPQEGNVLNLAADFCISPSPLSIDYEAEEIIYSSVTYLPQLDFEKYEAVILQEDCIDFVNYTGSFSLSYEDVSSYWCYDVPSTTAICPYGYEEATKVNDFPFYAGGLTTTDNFKTLDYEVDKILNRLTAFWEQTIEKGVKTRIATPTVLFRRPTASGVDFNIDYHEQVWDFNWTTSYDPGIIPMRAYANVAFIKDDIQTIQFGLGYLCADETYNQVLNMILEIPTGAIVSSFHIMEAFDVQNDIPLTFQIEDMFNLKVEGNSIVFEVADGHSASIKENIRIDYGSGATATTQPVKTYITSQLIADYQSNCGGSLLSASPFKSCEVCLNWERQDFEGYGITPPAYVEYDCAQENIDYLGTVAQALRDRCVNDRIAALKESYRTNCLEDINDEFSVSFQLGYQHYTLYKYDRAGNLMATVPPAGVSELDLYDNSNAANLVKTTIENNRADDNNGVFLFDGITNTLSTVLDHTLITEYKYNSIKQLVAQTTPDGGVTQFWYNAAGQLVLSQDAEQMAQSNTGSNVDIYLYSYTHYDNLGRIKEVGELTSKETLVEGAITGGVTALDKTQITYTAYTIPVSTAICAGKGQQNLRNRVSHSYTDEDGDAVTTTDQVHTYYSYDPHGNVAWLIQDLPEIGKKTVRYEYDLVSGNVNYVYYNEESEIEKFIHKYEYDADNRITNTYTSRDGVIWDKDASYDYYLHGPLARTEIGQDKIQGLDYTYTIEGYLKSINQPNLKASNDPGGDQLASNNFLEDEFGMELGYYDGDFDRDNVNIGTNVDYNPYTNNELTANNTELFNGNINYWATNTRSGNTDLVTNKQGVKVQAFRYDKLNRLRAADIVREGTTSNPINYDSDGDAYTEDIPNLNSSDIYSVRVKYDGNGNIEELGRTGHVGIMDDLSYTYKAGTNQLDHVDEDDATTDNTRYGTDIDDGQTTGNYVYDAEGNLIADNQERIEIDWTVYNKVDQVRKYDAGTYPNFTSANDVIDFTYDASGNRVMKKVTHSSGETITFYVRDASGNIMAIYNKQYDGTNTTYNVKEFPIYGSSRLGNYVVGGADGELASIVGYTDHVQINNTKAEMSKWLIGSNSAVNDVVYLVDFSQPNTVSDATSNIVGGSGGNYNPANYVDENNTPIIGAFVNSNSELKIIDGFTGSVVPVTPGVTASKEENATPVIIKDPSNANNYYIFYHTGGNFGTIEYITVNLVNGLTVSTPTTLSTINFAHNITAITYKDDNSRIYLYTKGVGETALIYSVDITSDGVNTTVSSPEERASFANNGNLNLTANGEIAISPQGTHLAICTGTDHLLIWQLEEACGNISLPTTYELPTINSVNKIEFSHSGDYLYFGAINNSGTQGGNVRRIKLKNELVENLFTINNAPVVDIQREIGGKIIFTSSINPGYLSEIVNPEALNPNDISLKNNFYYVKYLKGDQLPKQTYHSAYNIYRAVETMELTELDHWYVSTQSTGANGLVEMDFSASGSPTLSILSSTENPTRNISIAENVNGKVMAKFYVKNNGSDESVLIDSDNVPYTQASSINAAYGMPSLFVKASNHKEKYHLITAGGGTVYYHTIDEDYVNPGGSNSGAITQTNIPLQIEMGGNIVDLTYTTIWNKQVVMNAYNNTTVDNANLLYVAVNVSGSISLYQFSITSLGIGTGVLIDQFTQNHNFLSDIQIAPDGTHLAIGISSLYGSSTINHVIYEYDLLPFTGAVSLQNRVTYDLGSENLGTTPIAVEAIRENMVNRVYGFDYADADHIFALQDNAGVGKINNINITRDATSSYTTSYTTSFTSSFYKNAAIRRSNKGLLYVNANEQIANNGLYEINANGVLQSVYNLQVNNGSMINLQPYRKFSTGCGSGAFNLNNLSTYTRKVDRKHYELSDHLGNVRAVVGDRRMEEIAVTTPHTQSIFAGSLDAISGYGFPGTANGALDVMELDNPQNMAFDANGVLYVVSASGSNGSLIRVIDENNTPTSTITIPNISGYTYANINSIAVFGDYLIIGLGNRIYAYDRVGSNGLSVNYIENLQGINDMELIGNNLYVSTGGTSINKYDLTSFSTLITNLGATLSASYNCSAFITSSGSQGMGIDVIENGNGNAIVYLAYLFDHTVWQISIDATSIISYNSIAGVSGIPTGSVLNLFAPSDVQLSADNTTLYVTEWGGNQIKAINLTDNTVSMVYDGYPATVFPAGIELSPAGDLYIALQNANLISKITGDVGSISVDVKSINDYYPFGMIKPGRSYNSSDYRYGFNGQEKDDEISGSGNSNTATFWQYDTRLGRRWNQDPKPNPSISDYATFANNPIMFNDILGDTIKSTQEGFDITNEGFQATLGGKNPFGYDASKSAFTFNETIVNENTYNGVQQDVIERVSYLITSSIDEVNVTVVNGSDNVIPKLGKMTSLNNENADGVTTGFHAGYVGLGKDYLYTSQNVYLDRQPLIRVGGVETSTYGYEYRRGLVALHEIGGHAYNKQIGEFLFPKSVEHLNTEFFETKVRSIYKFNGKVLGGEAEKH